MRAKSPTATTWSWSRPAQRARFSAVWSSVGPVGRVVLLGTYWDSATLPGLQIGMDRDRSGSGQHVCTSGFGP